MKVIRVSTTMVAFLLLLVAAANGESRPTRKDLVLAKRASAQSATNAVRKIQMRRKMSPSLQAATFRNPSFIVPKQISASNWFVLAISGDFNGDNVRDVAAVTVDSTESTTQLAVFLGHGDGTFDAPLFTPTQVDNHSLLYSADLNKDGKDDIILIHGGVVDIFLSSGNGAVQAPITYSTGLTNPGTVAIADTNNDGNLDLWIVDKISNTLDRFMGNGDGTFQPPLVTSVSGHNLLSAVFADVNRDGKLDLVTGSEVLLGNNDGSFSNSIPFADADTRSCYLYQMGATVAVADLNGDGNPDIVVSGCNMDELTIYFGDGNGGFMPGGTVWAGFGPEAVRIADMDGDSNPDIVVTDFFPGSVSILLGDGRGNFGSPLVGYACGGGWLQPLIIDDFNRDGHLDVVATSTGAFEQLTLMPGAGDGSLISPVQHYAPRAMGDFGDYGMSIASADFNGDGLPDVVLGGFFSENLRVLGGDDTGITVFLGGPSGLVNPTTTYGSGGLLASVAVGDFNHDGNIDVVAGDFNTGAVNLFLGNGDGTFQPAQFFPSAPQGASAIIAADFNNDGWLDVAVVGWGVSQPGFYVLLNDRHGKFLDPITYPLNANSWALSAADLNNDGNLDVVIPHFVTNTFSVLLGDGDGTFQALPDFSNGSTNPGGIVLQDVNGDDKVDLLFSTMQGAAVAFGNGDGTFQAATFYDASHGFDFSSTGNLILADFNGDGKPDMAFPNTNFGTVDILPGHGDGTYGSVFEFPVEGAPFDLLALDINHDGAPDIAIADLTYAGITALINAEGASVKLATSPNPAAFGQSVLLTAAVSSSMPLEKARPTGTVSFIDNGSTNLGTATLDSDGNAFLLVPTLALGEHDITAAYSGDSNTLPTSSNVVPEKVNGVNGQSPTYALAADPTSIDIQAGQSAVFNITALPLNGFTGTINFSCGQLPQGVSCGFSPTSVSLVAGQLASVRLTVSTAEDAWAVANLRTGRSFMPLWAMCMLGLVGCGFIDGTDLSKRMRSLRRVILAIALLVLTGCGGGVSAPIPNHSRPAAVQVRATAAKVSRQLNLVIVVHQ